MLLSNKPVMFSLSHIESLPVELTAIILKSLKYNDIINLAKTSYIMFEKIKNYYSVYTYSSANKKDERFKDIKIQLIKNYLIDQENRKNITIYKYHFEEYKNSFPSLFNMMWHFTYSDNQTDEECKILVKLINELISDLPLEERTNKNFYLKEGKIEDKIKILCHLHKIT